MFETSFKVFARNTVYAHPPWVRVDLCHVAYPSGVEVKEWQHVKFPAYINVAVETHDGQWLCQRIRKFGYAGESLAVVGGYLNDPGEDPLLAAQRELLEESGYSAPRWTSLGTYTSDANREAGVGHLFFARGARHTHTPTEVDAEAPTQILLSRAEVQRELLAQRVKCMSWANCLALALLTQ